MDMNSLILSAILNSGIAQYPDKKLLKAAILLQPQERPTVPVRLYDDPEPVYREIYDQLGLPFHQANQFSRGITTPNKDMIYIRRGTEEYKNPVELAAALAHEQIHVKQPLAAKGEVADESEPYDAQWEVIKRNSSRVPIDKVRNYEFRAKSAKADRTKK